MALKSESQTQTRKRGVLNAICTILDLTNDHLGAVLGITGAAAQTRRRAPLGKKPSRIQDEDCEAINYAFDLPEEIWRMNPDDAARWLIENRPGLVAWHRPSPDGGDVIDLQTYACTRFSRDPSEPLTPFTLVATHPRLREAA